MQCFNIVFEKQLGEYNLFTARSYVVQNSRKPIFPLDTKTPLKHLKQKRNTPRIRESLKKRITEGLLQYL